MCGRIACALGVNELCCAASYKTGDASCFFKAVPHDSVKDFKPSYNVPPTTVVPVIVSSEQKLFNPNATSERVLVGMRFGIIPPWMKQQEYKPDHLETHLCRIEKARESKLYNPLLERGYRCVIPCVGYYEWQSTKSINKQPYFFYNKENSPSLLTAPGGMFDLKTGWTGSKLLYLAGVYSIYLDSQGQRAYSFAIITRETTDDWKWVHHRMPIVLQSDEDVNNWIKIKSLPLVLAYEVLKRRIVNLAAHPVDRSVINNAKNNVPKCVEVFDVNQPNNKIMKAWLDSASKQDMSSAKAEDTDSEDKKTACDTKAPFSIKKWLQNTAARSPEKSAQKRTALEDWLNVPSKKSKNDE